MVKLCFLHSATGSVAPLSAHPFPLLYGGGKPSPPSLLEATLPPPELLNSDPPPLPTLKPPPPPEPPDRLNRHPDPDLVAGLHNRVSLSYGHHKPASSSFTFHNGFFLWRSIRFSYAPAKTCAADLILSVVSPVIFEISNISAVKLLPLLFVKSSGVPEPNPVIKFCCEHHGASNGGCMLSMASSESKRLCGSHQVEEKSSGALKSFGCEIFVKTLMGLAKYVLSAIRGCEEGLDLGVVWAFSAFLSLVVGVGLLRPVVYLKF